MGKKELPIPSFEFQMRQKSCGLLNRPPTLIQQINSLLTLLPWYESISELSNFHLKYISLPSQKPEKVWNFRSVYNEASDITT